MTQLVELAYIDVVLMLSFAFGLGMVVAAAFILYSITRGAR